MLKSTKVDEIVQKLDELEEFLDLCNQTLLGMKLGYRESNSRGKSYEQLSWNDKIFETTIPQVIDYSRQIRQDISLLHAHLMNVKQRRTTILAILTAILVPFTILVISTILQIWVF